MFSSFISVNYDYFSLLAKENMTFKVRILQQNDKKAYLDTEMWAL